MTLLLASEPDMPEKVTNLAENIALRRSTDPSELPLVMVHTGHIGNTLYRGHR